GDALGFISGYRVPARPDTLFVWQVAVDTAARGLGLASRLLMGLLTRPELADLRHIETTIGPDNRASWALFERFASRLSATIATTTLFESHTHFAGDHPDEILLRIGPFRAASSACPPATPPKRRQPWTFSANWNPRRSATRTLSPWYSPAVRVAA